MKIALPFELFSFNTDVSGNLILSFCFTEKIAIAFLASARTTYVLTYGQTGACYCCVTRNLSDIVLRDMYFDIDYLTIFDF